MRGTRAVVVCKVLLVQQSVRSTKYVSCCAAQLPLSVEHSFNRECPLINSPPWPRIALAPVFDVNLLCPKGPPFSRRV